MKKGFLSDSMGKNLPASAGDVGWSLSPADPLGKEMATHSSILAWEIQWTEEPTVRGVAKELDLTEQLNNNNMKKWGI